MRLEGSGCDVDEISGSFNVSPQVIARQIENQDRIREACAAPAGPGSRSDTPDLTQTN